MDADCTGQHTCEPPDYPAEPAKWTCPECGRRYRTFNVLTESVRLPESVRKHVRTDLLGWTTRDA